MQELAAGTRRTLVVGAHNRKLHKRQIACIGAADHCFQHAIGIDDRSIVRATQQGDSIEAGRCDGFGLIKLIDKQNPALGTRTGVIKRLRERGRSSARPGRLGAKQIDGQAGRLTIVTGRQAGQRDACVLGARHSSGVLKRPRARTHGQMAHNEHLDHRLLDGRDRLRAFRGGRRLMLGAREWNGIGCWACLGVAKKKLGECIELARRRALCARAITGMAGRRCHGMPPVGCGVAGVRSGT